MKIKDIVNELNKYDENTEVFVYDEVSHERIDITFDVLKDKFFLYGKVQPYVKLISKLDDVEKYIDENKLPPSFKSVGIEFVESLHRYNSILKDVCIDIIKELVNNG